MAITKSQRALLAITYLSNSKDWWDGYNFVEASGMATIDFFLGSKYGTIEKLKNSNATKQKFLDKLKALGDKASIKAIDVIVMLHGTDEKLWFYKNDRDGMVEVTASSLATDINALGIGHKLRLLYSTACFGESHNNNFLNAGFATSVGAKAVNTNAATEFPIVLGMWANDQKISSAVSAGETGHQVFDALANLNANWRPANSDKDVDGRGGLRISSNP